MNTLHCFSSCTLHSTDKLVQHNGNGSPVVCVVRLWLSRGEALCVCVRVYSETQKYIPQTCW